jgi:hypothetical protein
MTATVLCVAVASLVAVSTLSAQESTPATSNATQTQARGTADSVVASRITADTIGFGGRTVAPGDTVRGTVVVAAGNLRVRGTVLGNAIAIAGDVVVDSGGTVSGDAIAVFGTVTALGGMVGGERRSVAGTFGSRLGLPREKPAPAPRSTVDALKLSLGWLVILLLIGFGVQAFAGNYLAGASDVLEQSFWRSFLVGIAGELAIIPALVLLIVALTVTVVGILLIPFAIVAFVLAVAGLVTLGFLATARLTGGGIRAGRARDLSATGSTLRGLVMGITVYLGMWVVAAAFQWSPIASGVLRALALAITFVAATAGLGAAILSKGGTRRDVVKVQPVADEMAVWQTPTPVTGVVAARRPTPAGAPRQRV